MSQLKMRVYENGSNDPDTTITIPLFVLKIGRKLIPRRVADGLHEQGIDFDELIKLSENLEVKGTLVEIEDHKKGERVVLALE